MSPRRIWLLLPALAFALTACARNRAPNAGIEGGVEGSADVRLRVENSNYFDAVIFILNGSQRTRMGMVTASSTSTFTIPRHASGTGIGIRLAADLIGTSRDIVTETISVSAGQLVDWRLTNAAGAYQLSVY